MTAGSQAAGSAPGGERERPGAPEGRVLVVDDEASITELARTALRFVGFEARTAASGREALAAVAEWRPDLIVLDVMLPDIDGFEVCRRLRAGGDDVPVIFLTARDEHDSRIRGFTHGGDDYVTKPFSLEELIARARAILRRAGQRAAGGGTRHVYADLVLDEEGHQVWRGDDLIHLSPTEFRLLRYLLLNAGRVLSKDQILDHVWQYDYVGDANVVETYISYLRRKLDDREPKLIQTVRGFGYALRVSGGQAR